MEAQMAKYFFRKASIFPVIQKCILKLAPIARKKNIEIELIPSILLPEINMDEERIYQVVENLIANAIKFTPKKGKITIKVKHIDKHIDKPDNCLKVSISDTGCGIPENQLIRIFDKFTRIETGKKTILGTGLGLSISKHIVNAHYGKIWANSKLGKGSKFNFTLPVLLKTEKY
jgi:two-component system sensor histidine kinase GlrK